MVQNNPTPSDPDQGFTPRELDEQSSQSLKALGNLVEGITPWLFTFGSWIFGGLIAFNLLVTASLITVGPGHLAILISITAFACALPLHVTGLFLLRLFQDLKGVGIDEQVLHAFQDAGFPIRTYFPQSDEVLNKRRASVALRYSVGIAVFSIVLTLIGMIAALWYMAWWVGVIFLAMVILSQAVIVVVIARSQPPDSEAEKAQKERYREYRTRQTKERHKTEQENK